MPDAIITSTESTFGTISGTFLETGATIQGTITGIVAGTLDGSVGVPGVGVPTGGTAGQVLAKIDGTNYNTEWVDQSGGVTSVVAPLSLTDGTLSIDESVWIEAPAVAATDGQIPAWDAATSRPVWIDNSARSLFLVGVNKSGSTIPKGAAVYVSGGQGGTPIISLAKADAESTSSQTIGVTTQAIANNAQGNVVVGGAAMKLDTSAYADGQILYLSPTVAGGFVTSLPTQPYHGVVIGYVTRSNNSNGVIEVAIQNYQELRELSDVLIGVKADGDLLSYESATGLWKNKTAAALGLATQSFVTGQGYITSSALAPYLLSSTAASVYQTQAAMSAYLTTSAAASTYYPLTGNPSNFLTSAALAGYATESWVTGQGYITSAALTPYLLTEDAEAAFYPLTGNPSNFIDASALTGYATQSWVTSQGYITSAALAGYATESWVTSQGYLTSAPVTSVAGKTGAVTLAAGDISGLGTIATVNDAPSDGSQYARKDGAWAVVYSPTQYITSVSSPLSVTSQNLSIDLSAYATQSFVTSQGYITDAASDGKSYARKDGAWQSVLPLTGGGFADYTVNGYLWNIQPITAGDPDGVRTTISGSGVTFPDETTQTTAGIGDASYDGTAWGRLNGEWTNVLPLSGGNITGGTSVAATFNVTPDINYGDSNFAVEADGLGGISARVRDAGTLNSITINGNGIVFPDLSVQTTAYTGGGGGSFNGGTITNPLTVQDTAGSYPANYAIVTNDDGTGSPKLEVGDGSATTTISPAAIGTPSLSATNATITTSLTVDGSSVLTSAGNLAGLGNTATARSNLGLGSMATETATNYAARSGTTFTGKVNIAASGTQSGLNLFEGASPTNPINGDIWATSVGFMVRNNGATRTLATTADINTALAIGTNTTINLSIANGATTSGNTKSIFIGNNGLAGSTTNITIGPVNGTSSMTINSPTTFTAGRKVTVSHNATTAGLNIGPVAGDPSTLANGDVWLNSTTNVLNARISGATHRLNNVKAWVNFNGTGTVAIRGSYNVTSITDNGTGNYTINFTTAMPDVNYAATASTSFEATGTTNPVTYTSTRTYATGSVNVLTANSGAALLDYAIISVAILR